MSKAAPDQIRSPRRLARVIAALGTPVSGTVLGFLVAWVLSLVISSIRDDVEGLAFALVFAVVWVVAALLLTAAIGALFALTIDFGSRQRLVLGLGFALWAPAALACGLAMSRFGVRSGLEWVGIPLGVVVGLVGLAIVVLEATRHRLFAGAAAVVCALAAFGFVVSSEDGHRADLYGTTTVPFGVIDEDHLERVLPGWAVERYDDVEGRSWRDPSARAEIRMPDGGLVNVSFRTGEGGCPNGTDCIDLAPIDGGSPVVASTTSTCGSGDQPIDWWVRVDRPDGLWSASSSGSCGAQDRRDPASPEQLRLLLSTIEAVTIEEFLERT